MKAKFLFYKLYRRVRDISLVIASSTVRGILLSQKVQLFILATHFLMITPTNSLFHSLLFLKILFVIFLYYFLFIVFVHHRSEVFPNSHLLYEPLPPLLGMIFITSHALLCQSNQEIHALLGHALLV